MAKPFLIEPHFRLGGVAERRVHFHDVGLDYARSRRGPAMASNLMIAADKVGAFQSFEAPPSGSELRLSRTVDIAVSQAKGRLYTGAYSVAPACFVPANSPISSRPWATSLAATTRR